MRDELAKRDVRVEDLALVTACLRHRVRFHGTPGVLMIDLQGLDLVLNEVANDYVVLGFDSFTVHDREVRPRLDYITDFGSGISTSGALEAISGWPRDLGLWIEVVLAAK